MATSPDKTSLATEAVAVEPEPVRFEYVGTPDLPRRFITERRLSKKDLKTVGRKSSKDYVWSAAAGWRTEVSDAEVIELLAEDSAFKKLD